jgi:surfactin synthase thioesterase subunit
MYCVSESQPLPCDISGAHDKTVTEEESLAWKAYTSGKFEHFSFSGEHFFIKDHQRDVLKLINQIGEKHDHIEQKKTG